MIDADKSFSRLKVDRRNALLGAGAAVAMAGQVSAARSAEAKIVRTLPAQTTWDPPPPQAPAKAGLADLGDVRLHYWDTEGHGEPVILLHPATGSDAVWTYQQPVFAAAGYRVIAFSRRGYAGSDSGRPDRPGSASDDLHRLAQSLGLGRFHLVGSAAGGFSAVDYALSHPERLRSLVVASSLGGLTDPDFLATTARITPDWFARLPASFRELGPSYRAANPDGVAMWESLERASRTGPPVQQSLANKFALKDLARIRTSTMVVTGDADTYMPPSRLREFVSYLPRGRGVVIGEAGHSAYWEQPKAFNAAVLGFLKTARS